MARSVRNKSRPHTGWPALEAALIERVRCEPPARHLLWVLVLAVSMLYAAGLDYPLVVADFAYLGPRQLEAYRSAWPVLGGSWLADATLGWWATLAGTHWSWHRAFHLALHAAAACFAFVLFRAVLIALGARGGAIAPGWIAFLAAALFALHPTAVYAVAYLSARYALLVGLFALIALWSTTRAVRDGGRRGWLLGPAATAAALACNPAALGIPAAMAFLAAALPATAIGRRSAWIGVALAGLVAALYVLALAGAADAPAAAAAPAFRDTLAVSSSRFLQYLAFWIVPLTAAMAVDMPQLAGSVSLAWPGWLGIVGVASLSVLIGVVVMRRAQPLLRAGAIGAGIALALYSGELVWPRLGEDLALARSYMYMACVALIPACLAAALPLRSAWIVAAIVAVIWLVTAAQALTTFSSHVALWDDAVRRVERLGPKPEDARIYLNRATVHRREGHTLAAVADYDRALALQPNLTRALRGRAQVHLDEKRYADALRDLDRVLELEPEQVLVHADRGLVLMQAGRLQDAGRAFDRAIARGAKEPRVFLNRGLTRLQLGGAAAAEAALADIEQALSLDRDYALAYFNRAVVFELAANAGMRLRDAVSPELMRAVASQNLRRSCDLGYRPACERVQSRAAELPQGAQEGPVRAAPEWLRSQEVPAGR